MKVSLKGFLVDLLAFTKESTPNFASKGKIETTSFSATAAGGDFFLIKRPGYVTYYDVYLQCSSDIETFIKAFFSRKRKKNHNVHFLVFIVET